MFRSIPGAKSPSNAMNRRGGFTMVELMVVIAIMAILGAIAVTNLTQAFPRMRMEGAANEVVSMYQYARFEAARRNRPAIVQLQNLGNVSTCAIAVYVDENRSNTVDTGDTLSKTVVIPTKYPKAYIATAVDGSAVAAAIVVLGSDGVIKGGLMPVTVTVDSQLTTSPNQYQVIVGRSGIARVAAVP